MVDAGLGGAGAATTGASSIRTARGRGAPFLPGPDACGGGADRLAAVEPEKSMLVMR